MCTNTHPANLIGYCGVIPGYVHLCIAQHSFHHCHVCIHITPRLIIQMGIETFCLKINSLFFLHAEYAVTKLNWCNKYSLTHEVKNRFNLLKDFTANKMIKISPQCQKSTTICFMTTNLHLKPVKVTVEKL